MDSVSEAVVKPVVLGVSALLVASKSSLTSPYVSIFRHPAPFSISACNFLLWLLNKTFAQSDAIIMGTIQVLFHYFT